MLQNSQLLQRNSRLQRMPATVQGAHRHQLTLCSPFRSFRPVGNSIFRWTEWKGWSCTAQRVRLLLTTSQLSFRKQSILHMQGTCPILPYSSSCKKGRDEKHDMFCFRFFFWRILMYTLLRCQLMKLNQASWTSLKSSCYNFKYNSSVHQNRREMAAASENGTATVPWDRIGFPH